MRTAVSAAAAADVWCDGAAAVLMRTRTGVGWAAAAGIGTNGVKIFF
jgi:hypothetical protein